MATKRGKTSKGMGKASGKVTSKDIRKGMRRLKGKSIYYLIFIAIVGLYGVYANYILPATLPKVPPSVSAATDTVTILNVGQADSSLISSDGVYCLIDAAQTDDGKDKVVQYLKKAGVEEIELFVITHFHSDHMSEALDILDNFKVNNILIPKLTEENMPTSNFFDQLLDRLERLKIKVHMATQGDKYVIGKGEITVMDDTINTIDVNNTSVATLFVQDKFSYLNTGDGEKKYEEQLASKLFKVTLFKAGHHGSKTSNTTELLNVIKPKLVAISAGADNSYGHPHKEAMDRLTATGAQIDITYNEGTLIYSIETGERITRGEK